MSIKPYNPWASSDPFATEERFKSGERFHLPQWPVKLWKISEVAPFFHGAHLLILADCAALCHVELHDKLTIGRVPLLCCAESDFDITSKLAKIITINDIRSVTVVRMDTGCCAELVGMVQQAIKLSRKVLPLQTVSVFVDTEEVD